MKFPRVKLIFVSLVLTLCANAKEEDWQKELDAIVAQMEGPIYAQAELNEIMIRWTAFIRQNGQRIGIDRIDSITDKLEENPSVRCEEDGGYSYVRHEPDEKSGVVLVQVIGRRNNAELAEHVKRFEAMIAVDSRFSVTEVTEKRRVVLTLDLKDEGAVRFLHADLTLNPGGKEHGIGLAGASAVLADSDWIARHNAYARLYKDCFVDEKLSEKFGKLSELADGADFNGLAVGVYAADRKSGKPLPKQTAFGIGILVGTGKEYPFAKLVTDGSPAHEAGIDSTSVLVAVEGRSLKGYTAQEVTDFIARQPDKFRLTYADGIRKVNEAKTVTLTKRIVEHNPD